MASATGGWALAPRQATTSCWSESRAPSTICPARLTSPYAVTLVGTHIHTHVGRDAGTRLAPHDNIQNRQQTQLTRQFDLNPNHLDLVVLIIGRDLEACSEEVLLRVEQGCWNYEPEVLRGAPIFGLKAAQGSLDVDDYRCHDAAEPDSEESSRPVRVRPGQFETSRAGSAVSNGAGGIALRPYPSSVRPISANLLATRVAP